DWWKKNPEEKDPELKTFLDQNPNVKLPSDEYAAVILCTSDPKKVDGKMRSKWSRVLRYAAEVKPEKELLRDFIQRNGGINNYAAGFPNRAIKIVIPFPAGGPSDVLARMIGQRMSEDWRQPVLVENRVGANTVIGAQAVQKASADGYTLLMAIDSTLAMNQYL